MEKAFVIDRETGRSWASVNAAARYMGMRPSQFYKAIVCGDIQVEIIPAGAGSRALAVKCIETGEIYRSQRDAAARIGIAAPALSAHLNGKLSHVKGLHFERVSTEELIGA